MGRSIPFDPDEKCDVCGKEGAYDFMGDLICQECVDKSGLETEEEEE
jgi:hypothetical protein